MALTMNDALQAFRKFAPSGAVGDQAAMISNEGQVVKGATDTASALARLTQCSANA